MHQYQRPTTCSRCIVGVVTNDGTGCYRHHLPDRSAGDSWLESRPDRLEDSSWSKRINLIGWRLRLEDLAKRTQLEDPAGREQMDDQPGSAGAINLIGWDSVGRPQLETQSGDVFTLSGLLVTTPPL